LTDSHVHVFAVSPNGAGGTTLFAGTYGGVFLSNNNGTSWTEVNAGLTNRNVSAFAIFPNGTSSTNLFTGTWGSGVFKRPLSEMTTGIEDKHNEIPTRFALKQNYPNPFNPSTIISYQLSVVSNVKLSVYDMLGREIAVLVESKQNAGTHQKQWNAEGLPSGVYLYRLQTESFTETKKLLFLK
jgi:hypothetical protein